jgi:hypothetical protein
MLVVTALQKKGPSIMILKLIPTLWQMKVKPLSAITVNAIQVLSTAFYPERIK